MIAKLLSQLKPGRRTAAAPAGPPARMAAGCRLYAIGDIHGRLDLLDTTLDLIRADEAARGGPPAELIFLGDLIDRGPDSAGVIERLRMLQQDRPGVRLLLGNHEEVFLSVLQGDRKSLRLFHRIGGMETILSYGISRAAYDAADFDQLSELTMAAVPAEHRTFLESFEDLIEAGDYAFVHAGIRPEVALQEQVPKDLRWIRDDFTGSILAHEKVVVHGHTITDEVVDLPNRIGLDTGAYRTGVLSAMGFEEDQRWLLHTPRETSGQGDAPIVT